MRVTQSLIAPPPDNSRRCPWALATMNEFITEYLALGVLRRVTQQEAQKTSCWSLAFGQRRLESVKIRIITDLRQLHTACDQPPRFKTDSWQTVGDCLSLSLQLTWEAVVDQSNFFFHLGLRPSAGLWIRIKTQMGYFQWTALPFGLHTSPYWTGRLTQVVEVT